MAVSKLTDHGALDERSLAMIFPAVMMAVVFGKTDWL